MKEVLPTELTIDDKLITAAQKLGKFRTKRVVVTTALRFFNAQRKRMKLLKVFGNVDFNDCYDYKRARKG